MSRVNVLDFYNVLKADPSLHRLDRIVGANVARVGRVQTAESIQKQLGQPKVKPSQVEAALGRLGDHLAPFLKPTRKASA